jgi:hypothetical protein
MTMSHSRILSSGPSGKVMSLNNKILQTDMNIGESKIVHPDILSVRINSHFKYEMHNYKYNLNTNNCLF